jgi:hypothetical protein
MDSMSLPSSTVDSKPRVAIPSSQSVYLHEDEATRALDEHRTRNEVEEAELKALQMGDEGLPNYEWSGTMGAEMQAATRDGLPARWGPSGGIQPTPTDMILEERGVYADSGHTQYKNALTSRTSVEDVIRTRATTFRGRQQLVTDMRYHPLGIRESGVAQISEIWAYPKVGYFAGMPVGAIVSSNMEYVPQAEQVGALVTQYKEGQEQSDWLDELYRRGDHGDSGGSQSEPTQTPSLLDSIVVPMGSSLFENEDAAARFGVLGEFDEDAQMMIRDRYAGT